MQKVERLLSIIIYLLNHKRVSAAFLANKYEVSIRTILRDINTLTLAGIPIVAFQGTQGGYEIMEEYRMNVQLSNINDYDIIHMAVQGLNSAMNDKCVQSTLEKVSSLSIKHEEPSMMLDFTVLKEQENVNANLLQLKEYISTKRVVAFTYVNAQGMESIKKVEPVIVVYKWYTWYLVAYDLQHNEYRNYKLMRMRDIYNEKESVVDRGASIPQILNRMEKSDKREYYDLKVSCKQGCKLKFVEYLKGCLVEEKVNGDYIMEFHLPKEEELWKGTLLAFGNDLKILSPSEVKEELSQRCFAFLKRNSDIMLS